MNFELVRTDHKTYKPTEKEYKDRIKSFSWSWRYSKQSFLRMKSRLISIVNNLVSQKNNVQAEKNRADLRNFLQRLKHGPFSKVTVNSRVSYCILHKDLFIKST